MSRQAQGAVLLILGATVLSISAFSTTYVNYVTPAAPPTRSLRRHLGSVAGVVLVVLAVAALELDRRQSRNAARERAPPRACGRGGVSGGVGRS